MRVLSLAALLVILILSVLACDRSATKAPRGDLRVLADTSTYSLKLEEPSSWRIVRDGNPAYFGPTRSKKSYLTVWVYQRPTPDVPLSLRLHQLHPMFGTQLSWAEETVPAGTMLTVTTDDPLAGRNTAWLIRTTRFDVLAFFEDTGVVLPVADTMVRGLRIDPLRPKP